MATEIEARRCVGRPWLWFGGIGQKEEIGVFVNAVLNERAQIADGESDTTAGAGVVRGFRQLGLEISYEAFPFEVELARNVFVGQLKLLCARPCQA